jgi:hypothetical protein
MPVDATQAYFACRACGIAMPAGTASACGRFLRLLMLQYESTSATYV